MKRFLNDHKYISGVFIHPEALLLLFLIRRIIIAYNNNNSANSGLRLAGLANWGWVYRGFVFSGVS